MKRICKNDNIYSTHYFKLIYGKSYEVGKYYGIQDSIYYYVIGEYNRKEIFRPYQIDDIFYTEKEMRKLKLEKINERRVYCNR
jgi:hypothetical protein